MSRTTNLIFVVLAGLVILAIASKTVYAQQENKRLFRAYLSLSDAYDTNVLRSGGQSANKSDNIIYIQPSLAVLLPFRFGADFDLDYTFTYLNYGKYTQYNTYYNNLNVSLNFYPVKNLMFGILDSYTMVPISPQLPTYAITNITQANYLNPYIAYKFVIAPRFDIDARYDFIYASFPGSLGIGYYANEPQINADILASRLIKIKPGFRYISQTFTASTLGTINQSQPYLELDIAHGSQLSFTGSYSYISFGFKNGSQSGNLYLAKLTYKPDDRLSSDLYADGSKSFDIFGRLYTQFEAGLDARYHITRRLVSNIEAKYVKIKYAGENYYTDASGGDIGLSYKFIPWSEIFATYYYYDEKPESSNITGYQDSRILVGIRAGLL
ncbi:MAG: hypothetical protein M1591_03910 [Deltaproteobacteria bacterium]|nr:hypothetical protein [Deltaproteobacteria bacterium]